MMLTDKTPEELDGIDWGEPTYQSSLVIDCHRLRHVALKDFTDFDLARMIRQKFSLDWLVPIALMRLLSQPFAGELCDGELISAVIILPAEFWTGHPDLARTFDLVVKNASDLSRSPNYVEEHGEIESQTAKLLQNYGMKINSTT